MEKQFDKNATLLIKGIAVSMMVYHHLFIHRTDGREFVFLFNLFDDNVRYETALFGKLCVAIFFCLSGFGIGRNRLKTFSIRLEFLKVFKRLRKLFLNYWKIFLIFVPCGLFLGKIHFNFKEFLLNFIGWAHSYNIEWWVIRKYTIIILITPFLSWFFIKISFKFRILIESLCLFSLCAVKLISTYQGSLLKIVNAIDTIMPWFLCFFVGYIIAEHNVFEMSANVLVKIRGGGNSFMDTRYCCCSCKNCYL